MLTRSIIKYIQSLQHKKFRDEHNSFIAEGLKVVNEFIKDNQFDCKNIYATSEWINLYANNLPLIRGKIIEVKDFELEKIALFSSPNMVLAEFRKKVIKAQINYQHKITLVLDDIQDPGNFGTMIRTADWFGIENIICSGQTVDMYNPKVVQSTMASLGRINIEYIDLAKELKKNSLIKKFAATLNGHKLEDISPLKEGFIIIGNESKGISKALLEMADIKFTIPGYGTAESLNAAVATGIILYSIVRNS